MSSLRVPVRLRSAGLRRASSRSCASIEKPKKLEVSSTTSVIIDFVMFISPTADGLHAVKSGSRILSGLGILTAYTANSRAKKRNPRGLDRSRQPLSAVGLSLLPFREVE